MNETEQIDRQKQASRILSIDAFRGITFFLMIVVNELHGISGISHWLKHMPADADAMGFADLVFPAFLFIVGMSIPFGHQTRQKRGETTWQIIQHSAIRALGLITMGFFMVNAESGFDESKMAISIATWSLLSYVAFLLLWGVYRLENPTWTRVGKWAGLILLVLLAASYRGDQEMGWMSVQWWGILGLIGWAYLIAILIFQITGGRLMALLLAIVLCTTYYALSHSSLNNLYPNFSFLLSQGAHAAHTSIVLAGLVCCSIFFKPTGSSANHLRFLQAAGFAIALVLVATILRPYFPVSKIYATPSWCFYSSAICVIIFSFLYYLIDLRFIQSWTKYFEPAATNPLVCYLLPFILGAILNIGGWHSPLHQLTAYAGLFACIGYAAVMLAIVAALNRFNFKMRF